MVALDCLPPSACAAQMGDPSTFQLITGENYTNLYDIYLDAIAYAATGVSALLRA